MDKIKNILVAVDDRDDPQAFLAEVATIAKDTRAHVTLLSVVDTPHAARRHSREGVDLHQLMTEEHSRKLAQVSAGLEKSGIPVTVKQSHGKRYLEIIREALRSDCDLIMKPAQREPGLRKILFSGTDMQLFRLSPCPVWAFKPTSNTEPKNILVAVDLLAYDSEKSALANSVLQWGKYIADLAGSKLHVAHIWHLYGEGMLRRRSVLANSVDKLVKDEERLHRQWLSEALAKNGLNHDKIQIHFHQGEANKLIPQVANATKADLLVMGTVGRAGIPGLFIGNTAESVLRQVDCSVLAVKPEGFLSPVEN